MAIKTAPSIKWFDDTDLDCQIAILLCFEMIRKAQEKIDKYERKNKKKCSCNAYQLENYGCKCK
ncbi:MAG: hypothetical protein WA061_01910 [Microgenomates group bacterium]